MLNIKYTTTPGSDGRTIHVLESLSSTTGGDYVVIRAHNKSRIHIDIESAQEKLNAMMMLWEDVQKIVIHFSPSFLESDVATLAWILCDMLRSFVKKKNIVINITHDSSKRCDNFATAVSITRKVFGARMLGMIPANMGTPTYMANVIRKQFSKHGCKVRIFDHADLVKHGFGLLLGIGDSANLKARPTFVFVERKGRISGKGPRIAFVGKGVTFDSGGLALKPFPHMIDMKFDKLGAAYSMAALLHLIEDPRWDHVTFYGAFPFAENAISDNALRPGDVIRSLMGKTVEVANPDAEGRLIMADALAWLHKYKPDLVIDMATLTGHATSISCWHQAYFYSNDNDLLRQVERVGEENGEHMIAMPTWTKQYAHVLKSDVADLNNSPRSCGDSFVATLFLKEFVPVGAKWIHFDLAHSATASVPNGNGIRTVIGIVERYLSSKK